MNTDDTQNDQHNDNGGGERRPTDRRPLGYWLRVVDHLLTREFAIALEGEDLTRGEWMLLSILAGDLDAPEFRERLARKGKRLRRLEERGWVEQQGDGSWNLTEAGRDAKDRIAVVVDGLRARLVEAAGPDAFATTMSSLEAIARELGWDESHGRGFPGRGGFGGWGRPRPFRPEIRFGFGPNRHHGFEPGRPGHPGRRPDAHDGPHDSAAAVDDGCGGRRFGHEHGHHRGDGFARGRFARGGFKHGRPRHDRWHHPHGGVEGSAERAYERGFDAGYERGRHDGAA